MPAVAAPPAPAAAPKSAVAAPPAPAAPPSKPAAPEPPKPPEHTPAPDPFDELDSQYDAARKAEEAEETKATPKPAEQPKPDTKPKDEKPAEKPPEKPVVPKDELKDKTPKQLRERLEQLQAERDAVSAKVADYEKKVADLEKRGLDSTAATEKLAALEKERDELKGQLRIAKFEASDDFKKQYQAPFTEAASDAKNEIEQLQMEVEVNGELQTRAAKWEDFAQIYAMDRVTARAVIKRAFGDDATLVMEHYDALKRLDRRQATALEKEKSEWSEHAKNEQATREKQHQFIASTWVKVNGDIADKYAEWLKPDQPNQDGTKTPRTEILEKSIALIDAKPQTIENKIVHDAQVRNRAIAFEPMRHEIKTLKERIAALEKENGELRDSDPRNHDPSRSIGEGKGAEKSEQEELTEVFGS